MSTNRTLMRFCGLVGKEYFCWRNFAAAKINNGGYGLKTATYTSQEVVQLLLILLYKMKRLSIHMQMMVK